MAFGNKPTPIVSRLMSNCDVSGETGCWNWTGDRNPLGYGRITIGSRSDGTNKTVAVHRLAASLWLGFDIGSQLKVCHHCDNPSCFNPFHLFVGTSLDNNRDCHRKGRFRPSIGVSNGSSKLTDSAIREMRQLKPSGLPQLQIARRFGVTQTMVSRIFREMAWRHVV